MSYHSKAPAAMFPGKNETYALLAHNLNHTAYGDKIAKDVLIRRGMLPAPVAAEVASDTTDPESEDEELPHPRNERNHPGRHQTSESNTQPG